MQKIHQTQKLIPLLILFAAPAFGQSDTLRLLFTGDIMGHTPQIKSAEYEPGKYDYTHCFRFIKNELAAPDLSVGNLELTLPGKGPYTGYPMFRSPDALADALSDAGIDLMVTANNHSNDGRGAGVINTIETLRQKGFLQTGTFKNKQERDLFYPLIVYKNNFKLAFLNYTYGTNGVPTDAPTIVNLIDTAQIAIDIAEAKARKPHCIIAVIHWGLEYQLTENAEQRALAKFMARKGVDLIVGMHPHVVQPIKTETANGQNIPVFYSLGNFISNQQQPHTDGGIMAQIELVKPKGAPNATIQRYGYTPIWRYIHKTPDGKSKFYVIPASLGEQMSTVFPEMSPAAIEKMKLFTEALRKRIGTTLEWQE